MKVRDFAGYPPKPFAFFVIKRLIPLAVG